MTPAECFEVFAGASWRMATYAKVTAWWTVALEHGTKDIEPLERLLDENPDEGNTPEEYHRRMREMGLE